MLPVMLGGVLVLGKRYSAAEYACACAMALRTSQATQCRALVLALLASSDRGPAPSPRRLPTSARASRSPRAALSEIFREFQQKFNKIEIGEEF